MGRVGAVLLTLLLVEGCLRKQDWEVAPPQWPRYRVEGIVRDTLTQEPVTGARVTLVPFLVLFPDTAETLRATTDVEGRFRFPSVPAMWGVLRVSSPGYREKAKEVVIQTDRYFELYLVPEAQAFTFLKLSGKF